MDEQTLYTLLLTLSGINSQVAYDHFVNKVTPPFVLYRNTDSTSVFADDKTFKRINNYIVDLVTSKKDTTLETNLETIFDNNHIAYEKQEDWLEDEQIYQIRYFI